MHWLAFALAYAAVGALALAMTAHHRTVFGRPPARRGGLALRCGGFVLLVVSALAATRACGWQVGLVTWVAMLAVSGVLLTQLLAFAPHLLALPGALLLGLAALAQS